MKNIAVFSYNFTVEYATSILKGIFTYFEGRKDVRIFYAQTKLPNIDVGFFEYQYWAAAEYLHTNAIDEVIVVSNSYFYYTSTEEFLKNIKPFLNKKLISVGLEINDENAYYTNTNCSDAYDEIVAHMKNVHGCKNFAFFSANPIGSVEAKERFEAYKRALKNNGLEYKEKNVFDGYFTSSSAQEELKRRIKSLDDVDFDVIICANDLMAVGCIDYFLAMGLAIPDQLKIVGFDNTSHAALCNPALTTIDPAIEQQGTDAAELAFKLLDNKIKEHNLITPLNIKYRHSCGCHSMTGVRNMDTYRNLLAYYDDISRIDFLFDFVRGTSSLEEIANSIEKVGYMFGFTSITACMYEEPFSVTRTEKFELPETVRFVFYLDLDKREKIIDQDGEVYNPHQKLIPSCLENKFSDGGQFILQPIFLGEFQYGYTICKLRRPTFAMNSVVLKILTSVLAQGYDYTQTIRYAKNLDSANHALTSHNIDLKIRSSTDELTGLLNRRGFLTNAQKVVSLASEIGQQGLVCFADLDGLKGINDNFGHEYGDIAIQLQSKVLKEAFRQTDIVGRLSGDEFGIVSIGMDVSYIETMRTKIEELDVQYSKDNKLPFELSISLGAVPFDSENTDLADLLKKADANLYEQKEIHHARMKKK
ncbi:MAG: GGDEF domain-containing protein [Treponema sp.]|nr:GGDEF domain-containing protein [Treponema sp.]